MKIVIVTGQSGAGKSSVLNIFEDLEYYVMDNLPPQIMPNFVELAQKTNEEINKVAIGVDIRGGTFLTSLRSAIESLEEQKIEVSILFLEASDETLVRRYKELRRPHPLDKAGNIFDGIIREKKILEPIKEVADFVLDTSKYNLGQLKEAVDSLYFKGSEEKNFLISISSFGYKNGIQLDADLVFDARFIPNPFYIPELKPLTGMDPRVRDYVFQFPETQVFLDKLIDLIDYLVPFYIREGKRMLVIAIGCTGGKHRSVALAEALATKLDSTCKAIIVHHRDRSHWD